MGVFLRISILLIIIIISIIEISIFLQAGQLIGFWPTVGMILITAMIGSVLLRHQGLTTLLNVRESINAGKLPIRELLDGLCLLAAGALLITPGFITDGIGLILFLPTIRDVIRTIIGNHFKTRETMKLHTQSDFGQKTNHTQSSMIIDGEFHEIIDDQLDDNKNR